MSSFRCVIQADSNADARRDVLEQRLAEHDGAVFAGESTTVGWMPIPAGRMFTEGRQSTSSVVSVFVDHATTRDSREAYMRTVCDIWTEVTECTDHEVVVSMTENAPAEQE